MNRPHLLALCAAVVLLAACSEAPAKTTALVERDSAGVRIVENPAPAVGERPRWSLAPEPDLALGVADGEAAYTLSGVVRAMRARGGGLLVADRESREIRFFDADGRHVRTVGARGAGPGEFESLSGLDRFRGDSLAAWDNRTGRLSIFSADGDFVRAVTPRDLQMYPRFVGAFPDGSWVATSGFNPAAMMQAERGGEQRTPLTLLRLGPAGELLDTLGRFPGMEVFVDRQGVVTSNERILFGRDFVAAAGGGRLYGGDTDRFEVRAFSPGGAVERVSRLPLSSVRVTSAHVQRRREEDAEGADQEFAKLPPSMRAAMEEAARAKAVIPHRETFPAFERLLVDDRGQLWVGGHPAPGDTLVRWRIIDTRGHYLGFVDLPAEMQVHDVADGSVIAAVRDEYGVEQVVRHRLVPRS